MQLIIPIIRYLKTVFSTLFGHGTIANYFKKLDKSIEKIIKKLKFIVGWFFLKIKLIVKLTLINILT